MNQRKDSEKRESIKKRELFRRRRVRQHHFRFEQKHRPVDDEQEDTHYAQKRIRFASLRFTEHDLAEHAADIRHGEYDGRENEIRRQAGLPRPDQTAGNDVAD